MQFVIARSRTLPPLYRAPEHLLMVSGSSSGGGGNVRTDNNADGFAVAGDAGDVVVDVDVTFVDVEVRYS